MSEKEIKAFSFEETKIRALLIDNQPWFVGNDVAKALGYSNYRNAVQKHVDEEDTLRTQIEYAGQRREMTLINESGLYGLILSSKLPTAKVFKHWVTSKVLPDIRKTGSYQKPDSYMIENKVERAKRWIEEEQERELAQKQLKLQAPKVAYYDEVIDKHGLTNFRRTAQLLNLKEKKFINALLDRKYVYRDANKRLQPYAQYVGRYFEVKDTHSGFPQTFITPEGRSRFNKILKGDNNESD
ncbi:putative antirepressor - phage associated [Lactobacillus nasalidis]|uniref:Antirepressor - phage associated n=1 Tax=Lactobacillus nasalidis TaxID=2797258 RepID=A0ABQ3W6T1_9LACO|nr:phage antirepressor [Lactobacillus nasalidis]GHV97854.1 putative antirepressor - phage associated [Lactobacillus nasalidis]GHW00084.1 putative antirepressor - phage associated [Lactobacillus nasalidis]GHW01444.1 putative antirepressor - phage associated [Lactobacillus nasalidis]